MKIITTAMIILLLAYSNAYAGDSLNLYKEYLSVLPKAKSIDDISKYMSSEVLAEIKKNPKMAEKVFQVMKDISKISNINILEKITSDGNAVLKYDFTNKVRSNGNPSSVEVSMKRENGLWKISDIEIHVTSAI